MICFALLFDFEIIKNKFKKDKFFIQVILCIILFHFNLFADCQHNISEKLTKYDNNQLKLNNSNESLNKKFKTENNDQRMVQAFPYSIELEQDLDKENSGKK